MLSADLLQLAANLTPTVQDWPRRKPGLFMVGGQVMRYADLHSLYHQIRQIFGQRLYNFRCSTAAPRILDCGAHIGLASLFFREQFPTARIDAFEADAEIADICRANFKAFGASDITVHHAAVWTHNNGVTFSQTNDDAGAVAEGPDALGIEVPTVQLRSLLSEHIDLLKLDVEGAEFALFEDCGDALAAVDHIVMEVHAMTDAQARIGLILSRLESLGFQYVLGDLHQATWVPATAPPPFEYCKTNKFIVSVFAWRS